MRDYILKIEKADRVAEGVAILTLSGLYDEFFKEYIPGQFAQVRVPDAAELLLRRPISIQSVDSKAKTMTLAVQAVGKGTQKLCELKAGGNISVNAPLGNGFPWMEFKNVWLIGGGVGVAPLLAVAEAHPESSFTAFIGFRNSSKIFSLESFKKICDTRLCTDDGSAGEKGFVTDAMGRELALKKPDAIYACGPKPFVRALSKTLEGYGDIPCFVSLEERMGCGIGACRVCVCAIKDSQTEEQLYRRVCADGPVFLLSEVVL